MKWGILILSLATAAMAQITMSEGQIKRMGIRSEPVHRIQSESLGPFIGYFEYSDRGAKSYTLSSEATVAELMKQTGDHVRKGEAICRISSSELLSSRYELVDIKNRLKLAQEYAAKDAMLYKEGVISQREAQKSALEVASLKTKAAEIENRFVYAGADIGANEGMVFTIRARQSGIVAHAPLKAGDKIEPFVPYLKIAKADAFSAFLKIPPKMVSSIHKGAQVNDKLGENVGTVSAVSSSVDKMSNSAVAVVTISRNEADYRAGTSSEFYIVSGSKEEWILLPRISVTKYKNKDICFVKIKEGFAPLGVTVQKIYKEHIAVRPEGFEADTRVVTEGIINLKGALSGMGFE